VQILESYPQTKNPNGTGHIQSCDRIPETFAILVRPPARTCLGLCSSPATKSCAGLIRPLTQVLVTIPEHTLPLAWTCPNSQPYSGLSPRDWTYLVPRPGSKDGRGTCPTPDSNISRSLTPQRLDSLGGYKSPSHRSSLEDHELNLKTLPSVLSWAQNSSPQASLQSKLPRRYLSLTFEWLTRSSTQALHRWSMCVRYS
jgi:hypothetical protein